MVPTGASSTTLRVVPRLREWGRIGVAAGRALKSFPAKRGRGTAEAGGFSRPGGEGTFEQFCNRR